jgi:hypothetical protein
MVDLAPSFFRRRRFRAIILTFLTTFVGIMPMLLETEMQARFLVPMAVSLFLVPSIYIILEDAARLTGWIFRKGQLADSFRNAAVENLVNPFPGACEGAGGDSFFVDELVFENDTI